MGNELLFDTALFGLLIRRERMNQGFGSLDAFSDEIERVTGMEIPRDTLTRIEGGKQEAKMTQYIAIMLTLYGNIPTARCGTHNPTIMASCKRWTDINALESAINGQSMHWLNSVSYEDNPWDAVVERHRDALKECLPKCLDEHN